VPENRADPRSRIIGVGFARFRALKPTAVPPTFHLPGGPGDSFVMALTKGKPLIGPLIDTSLGVTPGRAYLLRTDPAASLLGHWDFDSYLATAETWPSPDVGDDFRTGVVSDVPVVFAQGDWDTSTPVENLLEVVPYFPKGRVLRVEHGGHDALGAVLRHQPDVLVALLEFLKTGTTEKLPARVTLPVPKFAVPDFPPPASVKERPD
jgi:hypothetical protein